MSCYIPYKDLESTLKAAYRYDFDKYKNLSSIIESVLGLDAEPEAKIHAIWYYAGFKNTLANQIPLLQTKEWSEGVYKSIHDYLKPFLTGEQSFEFEPLVTAIQKFFSKPLAIEEIKSEDLIMDLIADLKSLDDSGLSKGVTEIIDYILANQATLDPVIMDPQNTNAGALLQLALEQVNLRPDSTTNVTVANYINNVLTNLKAKTTESINYISMRNAEGIGQYKNEPIFMLRKSNGDKIEIYYDRPNNQYRYYAPGTEIHETIADVVKGDQITPVNKLKDNISEVNPDTLQLRIGVEAALTGLTLGKDNAVGDQTSIQDQIATELPLDSAFYNNVQINATTTTQKFNAERLARITKNFPSLGRLLETSERPVQEEALSRGNGPILTFIKPVEGFSIAVGNKTGDKSFDLDTFINLAFVYSDNRVEVLDFDNPEHMKMLKSMLEVHVESKVFMGDVYKTATDDDIAKIKKAVLNYRAFENEVNELLQRTGKEKADIRSIFYKYYDLSNSVVTSRFALGSAKTSSLSDYISASNNGLPVKIQRYDQDGIAIGDPENSKLVVIIKKQNGVWTIEDTLGENEKIVGASGKVYQTVSIYLEQEEGINLATWANNIYSNGNNGSAIYVAFRPVGTKQIPTAIPVKYQKQTQTDVDILDVIGNMQYAMANAAIAKDNTTMVNFNNKSWGFDVGKQNGIKADIVQLPSNGPKKKFGIKFSMLEKPTNTPEQREAFNTYASKLTINLSDVLLNEEGGLFDLMNQIFETANITVPNLATTSDISKLANEAVKKLGADNILVNQLKDKYAEFSNDIKNKFSSVINNHDIDLNQGTISAPIIDKTFREYGLFDGNTLKLYKREIKSNIVESYQKIDSIEERELTLTYRDPSKQIYIRPKVVKRTIDIDVTGHMEVVVNVPKRVIPDPSVVSEVGVPFDINELDIDSSDDAYLLTQSLEGFLTLSDEDFSKEISAMKALIPDAFSFTAEGFEGLNVDGHALGYLQGLMIHLNSTLKAKGVAYHEGFHAVYRRLLTDTQQSYYLQKVANELGDYKTDEKGKYIQVGSKKVYANEFRLERKFIHLNDTQIKNLIYEEYLADSFAEYMETSVVPKTWMQKLFAYLKRIFNLFKKGGRINNLFYDISVGKFKNATITNSKANTEPIFSLYKGIPTANDQTAVTGKLVNQEIQSYIVTEVADKMTQKMAELKVTYPDFTDDNLFDVAKDEVLKDYNIQDLIDQKPNLELEIKAVYENHYANTRWLLGQFHNSDESFKLNNLSKESTYDNVILDKNNNLGKKLVSTSSANAETFKKDVVKNFNSINVITDISEIDDLIAQDAREDLEEEGGENFIERSSIGIDPGEGTAAFRKLFKYISYTYTDPRFGITRTRMVDSNLIFSTIRKITTNLSKEDCVFRITEEINRLTNQIDYFNTNLKSKIDSKFAIPEDISKVIDLRDSLQAVFDTLDSMCGLKEILDNKSFTITIVPTKNVHVFIQFANVFNTIDARLLQIDLQTTEEMPDILDMFGNIVGKGPKRIKEEGGQTYLVSDIVVGADLNKLREDIKSRLRTLNTTQEDAKDSLAVLVGIADIFKSEAALRERFTTDSGILNDAKFREFIDGVYIALSKFNLNIPYDVISTSLSYSFFTITGRNAAIFSPTSDYRLALRANKAFFKNFEKLNYDFFSKNIPTAINQSINLSGEERVNRTSDAFENLLKLIGTAYVASVGEFILKYDPTIAGSVTKNANGDLINKYCKPTPAYVSVLKLQSKDDISVGLDELIQDYFPGFTDYFKDNPLMDINDPKVRAFLSSLSVSAFAGFQQRFTGVSNKQSDPTTFKGIDDRAYILSMFGLFAERTEQVVPETKERFQTFKRILTQYEATSTSIVVDGIYTQYVDKEGKPKMEEGVPVFVNDLMKVIQQEYNLILKNFDEYKNNSAPKIYKDYNIDPNKDRGFTFNLLRDFFQVGIDTKGNENVGERINLRNELIAAAKENASFADVMSNAGLKKLLEDQLRKFGNEQVKLFNAKLRSFNINGIDLPSGVDFNTDAKIRDMFFNNWINGLFGNQLFDGPIAVGISSFANFFKRQKSGAAAGDNLYNVITRVKAYRAAVVKTITFYIDDNDLTKPAQLTPFVDERKMPLASNKEVKMFDGQSVGNLDRRIKVADTLGQLDYTASEILRKMRYKTTFDSKYAGYIEALRRRGIVFNSLKTVSASGFQYIKQSEHTLIRQDVSYLIEEYVEKAEIELANLYNTADYFRDKLEQGLNGDFEDTITGEVVDYFEMYKRTMQRAHSYFAPIKGRELLHNMLNSMEYHRIEQLMDEESSKKATVANKEDGGALVIDLERGSTENILFDLDRAVENVPNELTYLQVETGKIAKTNTNGIQQKLLIIAQLDASDPLYREIKKDIDGYQKGLADVVAAQTKTMMRLLDTTDKQIVGKIFTKIADGLREQGGDDTMLQWFELNNDGLPKNDPDIALITRTVVYYYYSMFNKNIFDKKIPGRKYYHVSPVGYQIIEVTDAQGKKRIVTQDEYKKNPSLYINATTRYPAVTTEPDGTMVVEVILPKELRNVDQKFLEKYLFKFFATRIPTENKRSMMVAKVVDYIDAAYGASIIVPYQMHMLAGSDFDIDALYAYIKSAYYAVDGTKMLYGDYTHYKSEYGMSEDEAKFMEYLTYMSNDDVIDELINVEVVKISRESNFDSEIADRVGNYFGGNLKNYFVNNSELLTVEETEDNKNLIKDFKRLVATFNVLSTLKKAELPTTPDSLKKYIKNTKSNPVVNVTLNNILQHKINILSNKNVYDKFMGDVNQRADTAVEDYKNLVKRRGLSESDLYNKQNLYTPTALVVARSLNSESRDSVGIAASFNKGVSMLATITADLKEPVGSLYTYGENNQPVKLVDTDSIIEDSVQLIGGAIGLFTDAPKNPYPGPLHLTSITTPVMCTMFALGFPKEAAIMFQSMPAIVKLVQQYNQTSGSAYARSSNEKTKSFNSFMKGYISDMETDLKDAIAQEKLTSIKDEKVILNKSAYKLIWTGDVKPDTIEQLETNTVPIDNFGFNLLDTTGNPFSKALENYVIVKEFSNYIEMANEISFKITKLTDALKSLKPDQMAFDRLLNTYTDLIKKPDTSKFSNDSLKKLFERYPVLKESYESLKYMDKMSKVVMMERTSFLKGLTALFSNIWGYQTIDITTDLKAFIQLQLQKASMEKNPTGYFPELYLGLLDAQTFVSGDIVADYEYLKAKYPMNAFLSELTIRDEGSNKKTRVLEMSSSKISKNKKDAIKSDFTSLLRDNLDVKQKAFRLAYYGMIKSGGQKARGGFYELLPAFLSKNMSDGLTTLRTNLVELDRIIEKKYEGDSFEDVDGAIRMPEEAYIEYKNKLDELLANNFNGAKLDEIITEAISKIVSVKMLNDTVATYKRVTTLDKIKAAVSEKVSAAELKELVNTIAPENSDSIVNGTGVRPDLKIQVKVRSSINEIELFVPVGTTLKLDLTSEFSDKQKTMLRSLGISSDGKSFYFPLYKMNIYDQMMVVKKIDGKSVGEVFIDTLAETEFSGTTNRLQLKGTSAEYEVVGKQGSPKISPIAFSAQQGTILSNLTMGAQQLTSVKTNQLPASMRVVRTSNRMYEVAKQATKNVTEKTFGLLDLTTIKTSDRVDRYEYKANMLGMYLKNGKEGAIVKQELYDILAQRLGKPNWEEVKSDPSFEDFLKGQSNLYVYHLDNGDINSPTNEPVVQPTQPSTSVKKKQLFTAEKGIAQKSFRGKSLNFADNIATKKETVVAMSNNRETGVISIDKNAMEQKFNDKAWTKPAKQLDGSFATPLAVNEFITFDEWFTFALLHEVKHDSIFKQQGETTGQYENRINKAALEDLRENYTQADAKSPLTGISQEEINNVIKEKEDTSKDCNN